MSSEPESSQKSGCKEAQGAAPREQCHWGAGHGAAGTQLQQGTSGRDNEARVPCSGLQEGAPR